MYRRPVDRTDLACRIYAAAHLTGTFTLRSGVVSHEYFDKYRFESDPQLLADIAEASRALVPAGMDALAGLELGGVPLIRHYFDKVILLIIFLSLLPTVIEVVRARRKA